MGKEHSVEKEGSNRNSQDPLPSNPYGLGGQFIRTIGKYATIVFLIVFIVIGLIAGGFYTSIIFNKQKMEGKKISDEHYEKRMDSMSKIIDKRFAEINDFSGEQIKNVSDIFLLHEKLRKSIEDAETAAKEKIKKAELNSQELLIEKEEELFKNIAKKKQLIDEMRIEAEEEKKQLSMLRKELKKKGEDYDEKSKIVTMRAEEIAILREQRAKLAKAILEVGNRFVNNEDVYAMALDIQKNFFPENKTNPIVNWLNDYARNPGSDTTNSLQEKLIGIDTNSLESAIVSEKDLIMKTWFKLSISEGHDIEEYYFGAKSSDEYGYKDIVFISMSSYSSDGKSMIPKVEDVNCGKFLRIMSTPDPENWYHLYSYFLVSDYSDPDPVIEEVNKLESGLKWGLEQFLSSNYSDNAKIKVLPLGNSNDQEFDQITYSVLQERHPEFYKMLLKDTFEEFEDSIDMLIKSKNYKPLGLNNMDLSKLPKQLQGSFFELLTSTVKKTKINIRKLLYNNELAGEIAAIALKENFRVVGVQPVYQDIQPQIQVQQSQMPKIEDPNQDANKYLIFTRYQKSVQSKDEGAVTFVFERSSLNEFGWKLTEFSENYRGNGELR